MATYLSDLNSSLHELMARHADIFCIGEDLVDPYGGAFKVSKGQCYEIYGLDKTGKKVEIYFDPATAAILEQK